MHCRADRRPVALRDRGPPEDLPVSRCPARTAPATTDVEPAGSALLDILVELGHLDERLLALVNDRLLDLEVPGGRIGLAEVRRVAAEVIFDHEDEVDPEFLRVIGQEWGLLFH